MYLIVYYYTTLNFNVNYLYKNSLNLVPHANVEKKTTPAGDCGRSTSKSRIK